MARKITKKVLMCLSGGVDSSVAAALLVKQGYAVTGAYMLNYRTPLSELRPASTPDACWINDYRDAVRVAAHLNIPIVRLDFTKEYKEAVLDYMFNEYEKGRTPNPDVLCNTFIKFGSWLTYAREHGFDYIATGHYARVERRKAQGARHGEALSHVPFYLRLSADENKDQTYFLHQLNQEQLSSVLFPLGNYTKPEVRKLAKKFGLPTAEKEESMGICFVGEVPMDEFLKTRIKPKPGNIVTTAGEVIGVHEGLSFYTIGQRHALSLSSRPKRSEAEGSLDVARDDNRPLYVVAKRLESNELVIGYENDPLLFKTEIELADVHFTGGQELRFPLKCMVRLRHRQEMQNATLKQENGGFIVTFAKPQKAVTPGQFAVFYSPRRSSKGTKAGKNSECLGGGTIE